jgi:peptidoglycan/LPS O-acetylase OafA/YrhL
VAALGLLALLIFVPPLRFPWDIIVTAIPSIGLGLVYGYLLRIRNLRQRVLYFSAIAGLIAVACVPIWFWGWRMIAIAYTGGALIMILYNFRMPRIRLLRHLGTLTLGIYLAHPFVMIMLKKFFGPFQPHWLFALATFALAALMTSIMRQIRYLRMMV